MQIPHNVWLQPVEQRTTEPFSSFPSLHLETIHTQPQQRCSVSVLAPEHSGSRAAIVGSTFAAPQNDVGIRIARVLHVASRGAQRSVSIQGEETAWVFRASQESILSTKTSRPGTAMVR